MQLKQGQLCRYWSKNEWREEDFKGTIPGVRHADCIVGIPDPGLRLPRSVLWGTKLAFPQNGVARCMACSVLYSSLLVQAWPNTISYPDSVSKASQPLGRTGAGSRSGGSNLGSITCRYGLIGLDGRSFSRTDENPAGRSYGQNGERLEYRRGRRGSVWIDDGA